MVLNSSLNSPLNILMVLHMPWDRNLGGSRVQLELAEEFQARGHHIEKFDYNDAFPNIPLSPLTSLTRPSFSTKAKAFVRANAHRFDIIDAHQGNLPFSKTDLNFNGLLVARSVGLYAFYEEFSRIERHKFPPKTLKLRLFNFLLRWRQTREFPLYFRSLQACDLINLPNCDELNYIRDVLGMGEKAAVFPFGLSQQRQANFTKTRQPAARRLAKPIVAFIGTWGPRKGSRDWQDIVRRVRQKIPRVRFRFLGTGLSIKAVLADLEGQEDAVEIIPNYDSAELPELLSDVTVGAFPSYIEGFGFAVLEKLACGIPTVAYDVPGPRETLRDFDPSFRVTAGDIRQFSQQLVELLQQDESAYSQLSQHCIEVVKNFSWDRIASETLVVYAKYLERQKGFAFGNGQSFSRNSA